MPSFQASSLIAGLGYLVLYPGLGAFTGTLGWTSGSELAQKQEANRKLEAPLLERVRGKPVETIAADPEALRVGQVLFIENCAACHGREARVVKVLAARGEGRRYPVEGHQKPVEELGEGGR